MSAEKNRNLDWSKPIQTLDGRPARLLVTDYKSRNPEYTHLVAIMSEGARYEYVQVYRADGTGEPYEAPIINTPPPKKKVYLYLYRHIGDNGSKSKIKIWSSFIKWEPDPRYIEIVDEHVIEYEED